MVNARYIFSGVSNSLLSVVNAHSLVSGRTLEIVGQFRESSRKKVRVSVHVRLFMYLFVVVPSIPDASLLLLVCVDASAGVTKEEGQRSHTSGFCSVRVGGEKKIARKILI